MKLYFNLLLILVTASLVKAAPTDTIRYDKRTITRLADSTSRTSDAGFDIFLHHSKKIDAVMGKSYAENKVMVIILQDDSDAFSFSKKVMEGLVYMGSMGKQDYYARPKRINEHVVPPDFSKLNKDLKIKYGHYQASRITLSLKFKFYSARELDNDLTPILLIYFTNYPSDLPTDPGQLNTFAKDVLDFSDSKRELKVALVWSKKSLAGSSDPTFLNTYANLLYKLRRKQEAIKEETQALSLAPNDKDIMQTIEKMKSNQPTWHK